MATIPTLGEGQTTLVNTPAAMAAMVNGVMANSDVLSNLNLMADADDVATLRQIGRVVDKLPKARNAFQEGIWNMCAKIIINNMYWKNDEWVRKTLKGELEVGDSIEDIWVEIADPENYDANGASTLTEYKKAEILSYFHVLNYQKKYQRTVSRRDFRQAFLNWGGVYDLAQKIIDSMYNAARWDYFLVCKYLIARKICDGAFQVVTVAEPMDEETNKNVAKAIQKVSNDMMFPDGSMNEAGVVNSTDKLDQLFIPTNLLTSELNVDVLASAFNLNKAEYQGVQLQINGFSFTPTEEERIKKLLGNDAGYREITADEVAELKKCYAVHVDKDWFFNWNYLFELGDFVDMSTLKENYFLHDWKIISYSPYRNAIVYTSLTPTVTSVTVAPSEATMGKGTFIQLTADVKTQGFASEKVAWSVSGANSDKTSIDSNGLLYVAPDESGTPLTVKAVSLADADQSGSATITIS